jgi:alpha-1,2-glucosyltransferase
MEFIRYWGWEGHDYRLWLETAWFLLINFVTGYVFLYRGFEWPQEPGLVQRFMW